MASMTEGRKRGRPAKGSAVMAQVNISITPEMKEKLATIAEIEDRSFSAMCCAALDQWLQVYGRKYEKQES